MSRAPGEIFFPRSFACHIHEAVPLLVAVVFFPSEIARFRSSDQDIDIWPSICRQVIVDI